MKNFKGLKLAGFALVIVVFAFVSKANAEMIFAINDSNQLFSFDSATPGITTTPTTVTGVTAGFLLRAIDFRPATGQLYAVGTSSTTTGQVFVIDTVNNTATPFGVVITLTGNTSTRISIDWNPVVDRLRIVTASDQNYRFNPNDMLLTTDSSLMYAAGDPGGGPPLGPTANQITAAAYTNNFAGATSTTLYAWDSTYDRLVTIGSVGGSPNNPNDGMLFTVNSASGPPPSTVSFGLGMDISISGVAYLNFDDFNSDGTPDPEHLGIVDLATGEVTDLGQIGTGGLDVVDFAVVPEPGSTALAFVGLLGLAAFWRRKTQKA